MQMLDRQEANYALAKILAYQQCGNTNNASLWARTLVRQLKHAGLLSDNEQKG